MPGVALLPRIEIDASLRAVVEQAEARLPQFMNQVVTLAHRPRLAHDLVTMYLGFQDDSRMDRHLIELAVLTVSYENRCVYRASHHVPLGIKAGLTPEALADLEAGHGAQSAYFTHVEKLVIAYAEQVTREACRVPSTLFIWLRHHFDDDQIVELTVRIALANFFNRLNDALQIELEPDVEALFWTFTDNFLRVQQHWRPKAFPYNMNGPITTLIFDFDGLILDTESADYESWHEIFESYGCTLSRLEWSVCIGSADTFDPYARLEQCLGRSINRDEIRNRRRPRFAQLMASQTTLPGVHNYLIRANELGLKLGIASSSSRSWVLGHLTQLGLRTYFHQCVCSDDVERTKPDPALFLTALQRLETKAQAAIAIEDSPNGVLAAKRSGIFCLAVPNKMTVDLDLSLADLCTPSLADLPLDSLLARAGAHRA